MTIETSYIAAFLVGLLGGVHCVGMCGGIVGALCLGLEQDSTNTQNKTRAAFAYLLAYNAGRIGSYTFAGILMGGIGWLGSHLFDIYFLQQLLEIIAALFMLALGLYIAGWWKILANVEKFGGKIVWKKLEPLGRRFMPVRSYSQAFLLGVVWGWLPCGLVYSALLWSTSGEESINGALFMLAFGIGTLPTVVTAGILTGWFVRLTRLPYLRPIVGISIIALALFTGYLAFEQAGHTEHIH